MNKIFLTMAIISVVIGCKPENPAVKTYIPKVITRNEGFNQYAKEKSDSISIIKDNTAEGNPTFSIKFRDTLVRIQTDPADTGATTQKFSSAQFVNTQKTTLLVQMADNSGLVAPSYLMTVKDGGLQVLSFYRPSAGSQDERYSRGINRVGGAGYLVDNDFFVTNVNAKVYLVKRQKDGERIQGHFLMMSPDRQTIAFLIGESIYQVHYTTDDTYVEKLAANAPKQIPAVYEWIQENYVFEKNKKGISFLKYKDDDRVVDISEFK